MPTVARHAYVGIPARSHWQQAIAGTHPLDIRDWYQPRFEITGDTVVATAGSCFAQHIGRRLKSAGFRFLDTEPAPAFLSPDSRRDFGYDTYSARYGNVYTPRQLLQLAQRALGEFTPAEDAWPWRDGVVDPFRPTIEPDPFGSIEELQRARRHHLDCVRAMLEKCELLVFTLGLTETFASRRDGAVFPIAPGVHGGTYEPEATSFLNFGVADVVADLRAFLALARRVRKGLRMLLTVSPVPLMATATGLHVAVATMRSKSVLRAACAELEETDEGVMYFPSYELINSPVMRGQFFEPDLRGVAAAGVDHVMREFFSAHPPPARTEAAARAPVAVDRDAAQCDEELLKAFGT